METFLQDRKIKCSVFILLIILSVFTLVKVVNEVTEVRSGSDGQQVNTIVVNGEGEVSAVSDIASLYVNINKDGATAKEAQASLNESITKTLTYLKEQNIDDKDIKSEYGGLNPKYSYSQVVCYAYPCPSRDPKIIGYTATQSITIKIREVDSANDIRTGLATLGITDISGPTFSIDNEDGFKDTARALAIASAREKAKILAKNLDVKLGKVVSFSEGSNNYPMYSSAKLEMMDAQNMSSTIPAPTLPKGENKITSNVTIVYEIR